MRRNLVTQREKLKYVLRATRLLLTGKIRWEIYRWVLREWPPAVAGRGGSYILDDDFLQ